MFENPVPKNDGGEGETSKLEKRKRTREATWLRLVNMKSNPLCVDNSDV